MTTDTTVKILLVDDKKENLLSLQVILDNLGYKFVEANSGKEALRILLRDQDFAIILMDVQMPIMDGIETAELIRSSDKLKHVPIIFLTANMNTTEYIFKGYQAGAVDYLIKPLSAQILKAKVMVFADLYRKNNELIRKEEEMKGLNSIILSANEKLAAQYSEIEKHLDNLRIANRELESFNYVSSHDLQEPLRKIQTFSNIILDTEYENLSEKGKYNFGRVVNSAERMRKLLTSLLEFSRINVTDRQFETVSLDGIVAEIKEEMAEYLIDKQAIILLPKELGNVKVIGFQFSQLLQNLISNSLKFSRPDIPAQMTITSRLIKGSETKHDELQPESMYCHITYRDNGIGFEPDLKYKIFQVFQRLHDQTIYEGTGIGLAIVKKIIENHYGFITADSKPMEGTTFDIYIPNE
jgi:signal transduction histidine kinase